MLTRMPQRGTDRPASCQSGRLVQFSLTREYWNCVRVIVILLVEGSIVLVQLLMEYLVELSAGVTSGCLFVVESCSMVTGPDAQSRCHYIHYIL